MRCINLRLTYLLTPGLPSRIIGHDRTYHAHQFIFWSISRIEIILLH